MTNLALRKKMHSVVEEIDERYLKAVYSFLKDFTDQEYEIDADEKAVLDARRKAHSSGKKKAFTLDEVNKKLSRKSRS